MAVWITDGKTEIGWDVFPDRKKPAICIHEKGTNVIDVYGYFRSEEAADLFMSKLAELANAKPAE